MHDINGMNPTDERLIRYTALLILGWCLIIVISCLGNIVQIKKVTQALAVNEARAHFNKDSATRIWASSHGGIYVPTDKRTPPNENLSHIQDRDITLASGKKFTLMNPAYMLRQIMGEYGDRYGVKGRITSLKPLRKSNTPDEWEKEAIALFETGTKEMVSISNINGQPYLRLIQPMVTRQECLKCHFKQGYNVGDVLGGVGISVPMQPYYTLEKKDIRQLVVSHLLIFGVGLCGIFFSFRKLNQYFNDRIQARKELRLSREQLDLAVKGSGIGFWDWNIRTGEIAMDRQWLKTLGYDPDELLPLTIDTWTAMCHPEDMVEADQALKEHFEGNSDFYISETRMRMKNGSWIWISNRGRVSSRDKHCRPLRANGTHLNINEAKLFDMEREKTAERLEALLNTLPIGIVVIDYDSHKIMDVNPQALAVFGCTPEKLAGRLVSDFITTGKEDSPSGLDPEGDVEHTEAEIITFEGRRLPVMMTDIVTEIDGSKVLLECFIDITDKKMIEKEQIKKEKLQAVLEMAGAVCHEFNQPLQVIAGHCELLKMDGDLPAEIDNTIETIMAETTKMGGITSNLERITRYETKPYLKSRIVDLEAASDAESEDTEI